MCLFSRDSDADVTEDLAVPEFKGLWEDTNEKASHVIVIISNHHLVFFA
jgi:hypothetical protein